VSLYICTCILICIYVSIYTYTYRHAYRHKHIYIYVHIPSSEPPPFSPVLFQLISAVAEFSNGFVGVCRGVVCMGIAGCGDEDEGKGEVTAVARG
jgi:hypothetical protein